MNPLILICSFLLAALQFNKGAAPSVDHNKKIRSMMTERVTPLSIIFPKNNQKVRGEYKIYGKATPGSTVKLTITSSYFKTAHDNQERISKGGGPFNRMNRKFTLTADRSGTWMLKSIEFRNAGWEESFTINATSEEKSITIHVFDKVHPGRMD